MKEQSTESADYEEILHEVGDFGKFQKIILLLLSCLSAAGGLVVVVFPFTAYQPDYRSTLSISTSISISQYQYLNINVSISLSQYQYINTRGKADAGPEEQLVATPLSDLQ